MHRKPEYLEKWKEKQTHASEEMVKALFLKLLPDADAHVSNYYPVRNSLKQTNENDIIITYQNNLFVIEVKAGSFPTTPPITDFEAHTKAYQKLAEVADSQCSRTVEYIANHSPAQFYDHKKNPYSYFRDLIPLMMYSLFLQQSTILMSSPQKQKN